MLGGFAPGQLYPGGTLSAAGGFVTLTDTLATVTDSIAPSRRFNRSTTDTAATVSDALAKINAFDRSMSDTAVTGGDSISIFLARNRGLTDTAATVSDSLAPQRSWNRSTSDTAATVSDSIVKLNLTNRQLSDTALTVTDSIRTSRNRALADTAATVTDTLEILGRPHLTDTAVTMSDTIAVTRRYARTTTDTAASISDAVDLVGNAVRFLTDTLANVTDLVGVLRQRAVTDTLTSFGGDQIASITGRSIVDTLVTSSDVLSHTIPRNLVDTLVTMSDAMMSNDNYRNRIPLWGTAGTIFGTTIGASLEPGEFRPGDWVGYAHTVWYQWTCPVDGKYRFRVRPYYPQNRPDPGPISDAWMAVYEYDPGAVLPALDQLIFWNDFGSWSDEEAFDDVMVNFIATAGERYIIQVGAYLTSGTFTQWYPFDLEWQPITAVPDGDDFPGRVLGNGELVTGNPEWATAEPGDPWYWIRDLDWPLNESGPWIEGQYSASNRTILYKFTPDVSGDATLSFLEVDTPGQETGETQFFLFDGDGVSAVADLTFARMIRTDNFVYGGETYTFPVVAGRNYYLWVASGDGIYGPDGRWRLRVRWPGTAAPANDLFENFVDLDDGLWHESQTTEGATWEDMPGDGWTLDGPPLGHTIWYRVGVGLYEDDSDIRISFKEASARVVIEWWMPLRIFEQANALVDTLVTMSDSVAVTPLENYQLADTLATMSDSVARTTTAARSMTDTLTTIVDLGISGAGGKTPFLLDIAATMSETLARKKTVARAVSDFAGNQFGSGVAGFHTLSKGPTFRGRPLTDTVTTVSDTLGILNLRHYNLADTLCTMTDSIVRPAEVRTRFITQAIVTMSDRLTRIPPVTTVDTVTAMSDSVAIVGILRGRRVTDTLMVFSNPFYDFIFRTKTKPRAVTDTLVTMSDGIS